MNKGNKKSHKTKHKNKEAIKFVLANRELDDPNINNPNVPSKILLQLNKETELTDKQKQILNQIPKELLGVYDEEAKLKKLLASEAMKQMPENDITESTIANQITDKKVKFDFNKSETIPFNKNAKIQESLSKNKPNDAQQEGDQKAQIIDPSLKNKKPITSNDIMANIEDDSYIDEIFKRAKVNAKIVEYNEFGLEKDIAPALLEFVTKKEFREEVDIFIPPLKVNELEFNKYHTDIKPEDMNDEYKEVDAEFNSDSDTNQEKGKDEQIDPISTSQKEKDIIKGKKGNDLEDNFILLANEGQLPVEFLDEKPQEEKIKAKDTNQSTTKKNPPSYKYITKEEIEFVNKKFEKELKANQSSKYGKSKKQKSSKEEFDEAVEEMIQLKKQKEKQKEKPKEKAKVLGLTQKYEDEGEYEEYESIDEEDLKNNDDFDCKEDYEDEEKEGEEYEEYEDEDECEEEDEKEDRIKEKSKHTEYNSEGKPKTVNINGNQITIEYMDKSKDPPPFSKESKIKPKKKHKKELKDKEEEDEEGEDRDQDEKEKFTFEDLEKIVTDKEIVAKTIELYNHHELNENEKDQKVIDNELDNKFIHEPKRKDDITLVEAKIVNLPKTINDANLKGKKEKVVQKEDEEEEEEEKSTPQSGNLIKPIDIQNETKEQKKLRKKLVKLEKKEKRKENKKVKNAFKEEKKTQSHQIAEANKVIQYGLSIKDL